MGSLRFIKSPLLVLQITISSGMEQAVLSVASTAFTDCWRIRGFGLPEEEHCGFGRAQISSLLAPHI